jgi:hypothetical protein
MGKNASETRGQPPPAVQSSKARQPPQSNDLCHAERSREDRRASLRSRSTPISLPGALVGSTHTAGPKKSPDSRQTAFLRLGAGTFRVPGLPSPSLRSYCCLRVFQISFVGTIAIRMKRSGIFPASHAALAAIFDVIDVHCLEVNSRPAQLAYRRLR